MSHIDDFECSCLGYLEKHQREYNEIFLIICSYWEDKAKVFEENLILIREKLAKNIQCINLNYAKNEKYKKMDNRLCLFNISFCFFIFFIF